MRRMAAAHASTAALLAVSCALFAPARATYNTTDFCFIMLIASTCSTARATVEPMQSASTLNTVLTSSGCCQVLATSE